ncbi:unnamed protein product, partial [Hymenolepis diminuta]
DCRTLVSSRTPTPTIIIKSPKRCGQCDHIRSKSMLVFRSRLSVPVNDKCKESKRTGLAKPVSLTIGTGLKGIAQDTVEVALPYHRILICSQTEVS